MTHFIHRRRAGEKGTWACLGAIGVGLVCALGGCASQPTTYITEIGFEDGARSENHPALAASAGQPLAVFTLGAGDALGWTIHVSDIVLAAARGIRPEPVSAIAEVPLD